MYCWEISTQFIWQKTDSPMAEQLKNAICNSIIKSLNLYLCHLLYEFVIIPYHMSFAGILSDRELGMITSSWGNRVVAILGKLDPSWFSSFRSCEQNGEESYDFFVQSASILCHLLINFRSCGCWSSLLYLSWHTKLYLAFPVRWTYQKRAALFARARNVENILYTRWLSTRRVKLVCTPRVRVVSCFGKVDES